MVSQQKFQNNFSVIKLQ